MMDIEQFKQFMMMLEAIRLATVSIGEASLLPHGYKFLHDSARVSEHMADEALRPLGVLSSVCDVRTEVSEG